MLDTLGARASGMLADVTFIVRRRARPPPVGTRWPPRSPSGSAGTGVPFRDAHWRTRDRRTGRGSRLRRHRASRQELRALLPELAGRGRGHLSQPLPGPRRRGSGGTAPGRVREALRTVKERLGMTRPSCSRTPEGSTGRRPLAARDARLRSGDPHRRRRWWSRAGCDSRARALRRGATRAIAVDAREAFVTEFVWPALQAGALYQGVYPLATAIARPLIARLLVETAHEVGATAVAHGCTGRATTRCGSTWRSRPWYPSLSVIAPMRVGMGMNRDEEMAYAKPTASRSRLAPKSCTVFDVNFLRAARSRPASSQTVGRASVSDAYAWTGAIPPPRASPRRSSFASRRCPGEHRRPADERRRARRAPERARRVARHRPHRPRGAIASSASRAARFYEAPAAVRPPPGPRRARGADAVEGAPRLQAPGGRPARDPRLRRGLVQRSRACPARVRTWTQRHVTGEVRLRFTPGRIRGRPEIAELALRPWPGRATEPMTASTTEAAAGFISISGLPV